MSCSGGIMITARKLLWLIVLSWMFAAVLTGCSRDPNVRKQKYLESGERYYEKGKYREAALQFTNALDVDSKFAEAHFQLARADLKLGAYANAFRELQVTIDIQPNNYQARLDAGNLLLGARSFDKAREQADTILKAEPNHDAAHALLANIYAAQGQQHQAISEIQRAIELAPAKAAYAENLAVIYMRTPASYPSAEQALKHAIELDPKTARARLMLAGLYGAQQRWAESEQQIRAGIQVEPKNIRARVDLAMLMVRQGKAEAAESILKQASSELADDPTGARLLADYYLRTGQMDKAIPEFARLAAANKKDIALQKAYAEVLLDGRRDADADKLISELLKANPKDSEVNVLKATSLIRQGKYAEAVSLLEQAVKDNPDSVQARYQLGVAALAKGDRDLAEKQWREVVRISPGMIKASEALADIAASKGDLELLSSLAENTLKQNPKYPNAYTWRAAVEINRKQVDLAEADLKKAIEVAPNSPVGYRTLAQYRLKQRKYPEADKLFEKGLELNANDVSCVRGLMVSYSLQHQPLSKGIARVREQIKRSPKNGSYYELLSSLELGGRDLAQAEVDAKKALELNDNDQLAVALFSRVEVERGMPDQAVGAWQQWIQTHPGKAGPYVTLGSLEQGRGNRAQAQQYYQKALQIDPEQPLAANNLAYLMLETGQDTDVALTLAETARRVLPKSPNTADTLAWAYYHKGTYSMAKELLQQAVKANDANPGYHLHLGLVYQKLSDTSNAAIQLRRVISLAPDSENARKAKAALKEIG